VVDEQIKKLSEEPEDDDSFFRPDDTEVEVSPQKVVSPQKTVVLESEELIKLRKKSEEHSNKIKDLLNLQVGDLIFSV
jgi:hypothetical protein